MAWEMDVYAWTLGMLAVRASIVELGTGEGNKTQESALTHYINRRLRKLLLDIYLEGTTIEHPEGKL